MKRFLIIQTAFLGDVILATPLIEKLNKFYPDAKIDFLLRKGNESIFTNHPKLNKVFIFDKGGKRIKSLKKTILEVRQEKYYAVINLHRYASSGLITALSRADLKIGFDKNPFSFLFDEVIKHKFDKGTHEVERNLKLVESLTDKSVVLPRLYPSDSDFEKIREITRDTPDYFVFAPTSVWFTKQLPFSKSLELLNKLSNHKVFLVGAPNEYDYCNLLIEKSSHKNAVNLCGQLTILQSAALIKGAKMNFVNDSAPMHLASAMDAPVCVFYCSTVPEFGFGPLSSKSKILQVDNLNCRPCGLHGYQVCPKGHFKCGDILLDNFLE